MKIFSVYFSMGIFAALQLSVMLLSLPSEAAKILPFNRSCVQILGRGLGKNGTPLSALMRPYSEEDLAKADALVKEGLLSVWERDNLVRMRDISRVDSLLMRGGITRNDYDQLRDTFGTITPSAPRDSEAYQITLRVDGKPVRSHVYAQFRESFILGPDQKKSPKKAAIALLDPLSRLAFAVVAFEVLPDQIVIDWIRVDKQHRDFGYGELLILFLKKSYPQNFTLVSEIAGVNKGILEYGLGQGLSSDEAAKSTPLYKMQVQAGFRDIRVYSRPGPRFYLEAKRRR